MYQSNRFVAIVKTFKKKKKVFKKMVVQEVLIFELRSSNEAQSL